MCRRLSKSRAGLKRKVLAVALFGTLPSIVGNCKEADEFRSVAGDSLHSGLQSIATGILDGIFAVYDPDSDSSGN